ncbi:MAG: tetratricopeptide repeat protein [bacterium]
MAKKKKKQKKQKANILHMPLSPKQYIRTKGRQLPIFECLITEEWEEAGFANIVIARKHKNDHITCGIFQVDLLCLGVRETIYGFNFAPSEYENFIELYDQEEDLVECEYALAHNIIYGAVEFASKYGLQPHKDFAVTQYLLEKEDETIESLDIEFGEDGQPCVVTQVNEKEPTQIIEQLEKTAGSGNYKVIYVDEYGYAVDDYDDLEDYPDEDWEDFEEDKQEFIDKDPFEMIDDLYEAKFGKEKISSVKPENLEMLKYKINYGAIKEPNYFSEEEDKKKAAELRFLSISKKAKDAIPVLKELIKKFPQNPIYYNYLANAYQNSGDSKAAAQTIEYSYQRFPGYLFARCNYAQNLLNKQKFEKIPDVFDNKFELQSIYPDRTEFHVSEFLGFYSVMCRYFTEIDDIKTADIYCNLLQEFEDIDYPLRDLAIVTLKAKKFEKVFGVSPFEIE